MNVALLAEGVDRNIPVCKAQLDLGPVALLAEGVDRNLCSKHYKKSCTIVALLAEGVDRNLDQGVVGLDLIGRPPRGGRG